jgi:hypothetical protein
MRRREFISLLGGAAASSSIWPFAARAQQATMPVVGVLGSTTREECTPYMAAFRRGNRKDNHAT